MRSLVLVPRDLAAGLFALLMTFAGNAIATPCPPSARLDGDPEIAAALAEKLEARGIPPAGACAAVVAEVVAVEGKYLITVVDAWGRKASRHAATLDTAASLIESWARADLEEPLLRTAPEETPAISEAPAEAPPAATPPEAPSAPTFVSSPLPADDDVGFSLRLAAELGSSSDGSGWAGVAAGGCGQIGAFCFGGTARAGQRFGRDTRRAHGLELLADVTLPISLGALELRPAFGLGGSWRGAGDRECRRGRSGRTCDGLFLEDDGDAVMAAETRLDGSLALSPGFAVELTTSASYAPFDLGGRWTFRAGAGIRWSGL